MRSKACRSSVRSSNARAATKRPFSAAKWRAVYLANLSTAKTNAFGSGTRSNSARTAAPWPLSAARCSAVWPARLSRASANSARVARSCSDSNRARIVASWPLSDAKCKAVCPNLSALVISKLLFGTNSNKARTTDSSPHSAARCNGFLRSCRLGVATSTPRSWARASKPRATASCPLAAARCKGVKPLRSSVAFSSPGQGAKSSMVFTTR
mmetsp:Transcript_97155/g.280385  ORF Transcript_97155/g.280385 Transcript_97155/m.280385 type:complete len:211 (-) Transcript_97155:359-991(-)